MAKQRLTNICISQILLKVLRRMKKEVKDGEIYCMIVSKDIKVKFQKGKMLINKRRKFMYLAFREPHKTKIIKQNNWSDSIFVK